MSKKIKLTEEQIVAIEKYLREDGTVRGAAREVLGKESRESTIRNYIRKGIIDLEGEEILEEVEEDEITGDQLEVLCEHPDFSISNLAKRLRTAQRTNNQLRKVQRELFDGSEGDVVSLEDIMKDFYKFTKNTPVNVLAYTPEVSAEPATLEILFSDLQIGKVTRHFNKDTAIQGVKTYGEGILKEIQMKSNKFKLEKIVFELLGDLAEDDTKHGIGSAISTDCGLAEQLHLATTSIWQYILEPLAQMGVEMEVVCIVGNHASSTHKGMGNFKEGKYGYDYVIFKTLEEYCKIANHHHITFNIPEGTFGHTTIYGKHVILEHGYHSNPSEKGMVDQMRKRGAQLKIHPTYWRQGDRHHHITYGQGEQILNGAFFGVDSEGLEYSGILGFSSIPSQTLVWHTDEKSEGKGTVKDVVNIQVFIESED